MIVENVKNFMKELYEALNTRYDVDKVKAIETYNTIIHPVNSSFNLIVNNKILIYFNENNTLIFIKNYSSKRYHEIVYIDLDDCTKIYLGLRCVEILDYLIDERK